MTLRARQAGMHVLNMRTRFPFKYGIASLTALPHLFVTLELEVDGRAVRGISAEGLPPKWFTKNPETTFQEDLPALLEVIESAAALAVELPARESLFDWWLALHRAQGKVFEGRHPPLLAHLGTSLIERAAIDAFCRHAEEPFWELLGRNAFGVRLEELHPELAGSRPADWLPGRPVETIGARHTVGLGDPLTPEEGEATRPDDALPYDLESCIGRYGLKYFKIKLSGEREADHDRLVTLATLLPRLVGPRLAFTLDGNEQYRSVGAFREDFEALNGNPAIGKLFQSLLFVEQPLHRDVALEERVRGELARWANRPPMIIDESDGELDSLRRAVAAGYNGTSHKNCKGVFKGVANAALLAHFHKEAVGRSYILSGEDLANVEPVALTQDLAVMAALGLGHAERNGHHYFAGLGMYPEAFQAAALDSLGDLYERHPKHGWPTLTIQNGGIALGGVNAAPFGAPMLDATQFTPLEKWRVESLEL